MLIVYRVQLGKFFNIKSVYLYIEIIILFRGAGLLLRYASQNSLDESSQKQVPRSGRRERTPYRNSSHTVRAFEVLQSLRRYVVHYLNYKLNSC